MIQSSWIRQVLLHVLQFCSGLFSHVCPQFMSFAEKDQSHGVKTRHKDADLFEMMWKDRWWQILSPFAHHLFPHWQTANAGHIWLGNWRDQSLWWSELSKSLDPHFGNWLRDHVGAPGRFRSCMNGIVKDNKSFAGASMYYPSKSRMLHVNCRLASPNRTIDGHPYTEWRAPCHICEPKEARRGVCSGRAMDEESPVIWLEQILL